MDRGKYVNKKVLLILGGGEDQITGILKAKEMGLYTIVLDGNKDAKAKGYADEFYVISIKHIEQIEQFLKFELKKKVDGVIAFGVDIASIISKTSDLLNVNYTISYKSAKLSEDKFSSKEFMRDNNIPTSTYKLIKNIKEIEEFIHKNGIPIILKPVDNSASRGISYIEKKENLDRYYKYAQKFSNNKRVLVEQYLHGYQISTESFVINKEVVNIAFLDRNYFDKKRFLPNIIENGGDMPSIYMKNRHKKQLRKYIKTISEKLNIINGVIKGDIVIYNDEVHIIEFALRLSGGNFSTICIPNSLGIDFVKIAIKLHLGLNIDKKELTITKENYIAMRYKFVEDIKCLKNLQIKKIKIPKRTNNIVFLNMYIKKGEKVYKKTTDHAKRLCCAVAKGESRDKAIKSAQEFLNNLEIIFE